MTEEQIISFKRMRDCFITVFHPFFDSLAVSVNLASDVDKLKIYMAELLQLLR